MFCKISQLIIQKAGVIDFSIDFDATHISDIENINQHFRYKKQNKCLEILNKNLWCFCSTLVDQI